MRKAVGAKYVCVCGAFETKFGLSYLLMVTLVKLLTTSVLSLSYVEDGGDSNEYFIKL